MPKVTFIQPGGEAQTFDAEIGKSLMQVAVDNMVKGIIGECGGSCSCATCHLYVDEPWRSKLLPPDAQEQGMLEGAIEPKADSRLSCQIEISDAIDGLTARIPAGQV
jgi:ferredoxin, 2Fe-2S